MRKLSFIEKMQVEKNSVKHIQLFYWVKKDASACRRTRNAVGTKSDRANVSTAFSSSHKLSRLFLQPDSNTYSFTCTLPTSVEEQTSNVQGALRWQIVRDSFFLLFLFCFILHPLSVLLAWRLYFYMPFFVILCNPTYVNDVSTTGFLMIELEFQSGTMDLFHIE